MSDRFPQLEILIATDQEKMHAERYVAHMEGDFPGMRPGGNTPTEYRMVNAAEYSAYQLGQINRNLARLVDLLEKRGQ